MKITRVDFEWKKKPDRIVKEMINDDAHLYMANEMKRLMEPYVPATQEEMLAQNVRVYTENDAGIVHYQSNYAHYQYEGELYVSSKTGSSWARKGEYKIPAGKKLEYSKFPHPLATSHWDKAMMTVRGDDLTKAMQRYIDRGGK